MTGSFDSSGCPTVEIEISGPLGNKTRFTALMDTGFSGFLSLPLLNAFPIGLILHGTMSVVLADGSTHAKLTCLGAIHFDGETQSGIIIIEPQGDGLLVGMEFLRKFGRQLIVDPASNRIEFVPTTPL